MGSRQKYFIQLKLLRSDNFLLTFPAHGCADPKKFWRNIFYFVVENITNNILILFILPATTSIHLI